MVTPVMERLGAVCEAAAKGHIGEGGAHTGGTPTGARRGSGPAVVTGALRRAVTHELVGAKTVRIGAADIPHPAEKAGWKAPRATSGQIGGYLEEVWGYPWLQPAVDETQLAAEAVVSEALKAINW